MKTAIITLVSLIAIFESNGQKHQISKTLQLDIGIGNHGTGDMKGYNINVEYKKDLPKQISYTIGLTTTIHNGEKPIFYNDANNQMVDASYRYNTSGVQIACKVGLRFLKSKNTDIGARIGSLFRYQSSTYYDDLNVLFPIITGLPFPVTTVINKTSQETLSIGAIGQLYFSQFISKRHFLGLNANFQLDSKGDTITQLQLTVGIRL